MASKIRKQIKELEKAINEARDNGYYDQAEQLQADYEILLDEWLTK